MPLQNSTEFNSGLSIYDDRGDVFVKGLTYQLAATEEEALNLLFEVNRDSSMSKRLIPFLLAGTKFKKRK